MRSWLYVSLFTCLGSPLAVLASPAVARNALSARYAVSDLGALRLFQHSHWSRPTAVNDNGQVALNTVNEGQAAASVACLWDKGGTTRITDFPPEVKDVENLSLFSVLAFPAFHGMRLNTFPTGPWSEAFGLNNKGQVVGSYYTSINPWSRPFVFYNGQMRLLDTPMGANRSAFSRALGINDVGQIVGCVDFADGTRRAFLWTHEKPTELPTLGGKVSEADAINAAGTVVGMSVLADGAQHAVLWERGKVRDIHPLGFKASYAVGINDKGQIVGTVSLADGSRHGCVWTQGRTIDLGTLGGKNSDATSINSVGQVVGSADIGTKVEGYNEVPHAFLWNAKDGLRDLNTLVPATAPAAERQELWGAMGINGKGQIAAYQRYGHALLLTPVAGKTAPPKT